MVWPISHNYDVLISDKIVSSLFSDTVNPRHVTLKQSDPLSLNHVSATVILFQARLDGKIRRIPGISPVRFRAMYRATILTGILPPICGKIPGPINVRPGMRAI